MLGAHVSWPERQSTPPKWFERHLELARQRPYARHHSRRRPLRPTRRFRPRDEDHVALASTLASSPPIRELVDLCRSSRSHRMNNLRPKKRKQKRQGPSDLAFFVYWERIPKPQSNFHAINRTYRLPVCERRLSSILLKFQEPGFWLGGNSSIVLRNLVAKP